jgi:hypothetical protein
MIEQQLSTLSQDQEHSIKKVYSLKNLDEIFSWTSWITRRNQWKSNETK